MDIPKFSREYFSSFDSIVEKKILLPVFQAEISSQKIVCCFLSYHKALLKKVFVLSAISPYSFK